MGILGPRALDINVSDRDFCYILGYLATPGRVGFIEAQIPEDRVWEFQRAYPGQEYYPITQGETSGGNIMKQGCQFRIYFDRINNCPKELVPFLGKGNTGYVMRINKGAFIEKIVENYGFCFGHVQNPVRIRSQIQTRHPMHLADFDAGYNIPL